jgi:predicted mannosyl-3-phosphoglycerate phosphatase (HAD superfamily)
VTGNTATPVVITTDLDRTLIFSRRASVQLGGGLPADPVESSGTLDAAGELSHAARDALLALPGNVMVCVATSRSLARLVRLRLPFAATYSIAANGGVVLAGAEPDPEWAEQIARLLATVAPAAQVRAAIADSATAAGWRGGGAWLQRFGDDDEMCCVATIDRQRLDDQLFADLAAQCGRLGWRVSLTGRKLYAFPAGFGKEHAAAYVADKVARETGGRPLLLAAGDAEHDRVMLADADLAWVPAGSELAARADGEFAVTKRPGHAAAAQIASEWLTICLA